MDDPNDRRPMRLLDSRLQDDGELSDSDDEGEGGRRDHMSHKDLIDKNAEGNHKFGMGVGILASSIGATHGAGPSGHHTIARVISTSKDDSPSMEIDTPWSQCPAPVTATMSLLRPPTPPPSPASTVPFSSPKPEAPAVPTPPAAPEAPKPPPAAPGDDAMIVEPSPVPEATPKPDPPV